MIILLTLILKYYYVYLPTGERTVTAGYRLYVIQGNQFGKVNIGKLSLNSVNEPPKRLLRKLSAPR